MTDLTGIKKRFSALSRLLDERSRRLVAGAESLALPRGGISAVSRATGISRSVIRQGLAELKNLIAATTTAKGLKVHAELLFHLLVPGGKWLTAIRSPVSSVPHQFLLLRIHRDHRLLAGEETLHLAIDSGTYPAGTYATLQPLPKILQTKAQ